ncbi:hypothetical protein PoB_006076300 [Plakobranchus ocellatus]|uniref:Uncharacterized protein n=1 Tax=Plakobranchus ocellatus TaxID=259542 RepID=A0AAV4CQT8_9GAST|nr:hypothetical protein PoB_006076300 [Plakobranchus ocellatus]
MKPTLNLPVSSSRTLTVTVMAALLLNGLTMGALLPEATIDNPCRTIDTVNQVFPPLDSQFNEAINEVNAVKFSAEQLITALQGDGFLTSDDIAALNPTFSHLPGLPLRLENDNPNLDNPVHNKVISVFQALRQAWAPVAGLEPATEGSLQISSPFRRCLYPSFRNPAPIATYQAYETVKETLILN